MSTNVIHSECTICLNVFKNPKILPCFHSFCIECLKEHIETHRFYNRFKCPICRKFTEIPTAGASGFTNNFYVSDAVIGQKCYCEQHKQREVDFYCRDCQVAVCPKCALDNHKQHTVVELSDVDSELKDRLYLLKADLEGKIEKLQTELDILKNKLDHVSLTADVACRNVDAQVDKIHKEAASIGKEIKDRINKTEEDEVKKIQCLLEERSNDCLALQAAVRHSEDVFDAKSTNAIVEDLPKVEKIVANSREFGSHKPLVLKCNYFPLTEVDSKSIRQQLGRLETNFETSFTCRFDHRKLREGEETWGEVCVIQDLPWSVVVKRDGTQLGVYLGLKKTDDKIMKRSCATYSLKLLNDKDESSSVKRDRKRSTFTPGVLVGWDWFYQWEKLLDDDRGFLNDHEFSIHADVSIII